MCTQSEPTSRTPMSVMLDSVPKRGGQRGNKNTKRPRLSSPDDVSEQPKLSRADKKEQRQLRMLETKRKETIAEEAADKRMHTEDLKSGIKQLTVHPVDGGYGFKSLGDFEMACLDTDNQHLLSTVSKMAMHKDPDIIARLAARDKAMGVDAAWLILGPVFEKEGRAIKKLLARGSSAELMEMLRTFSMERLSHELGEVAPWTWRFMETVAIPKAKQDADGQ
jgi:hypothetical protein